MRLEAVLLVGLMACGTSTPTSEAPAGPCADLDASGCATVAADSLESDPAHALVLWEDACLRLNHGPACLRLGDAVMRGGAQNSGRPGSPGGRVVHALSHGCDLRFGEACHALGMRYMQGRSVSRDKSQAAGQFGRACEAGYVPGCVDAGILLEATDPFTAAERFEEACDAGDGRGCTKLGLAMLGGLTSEQQKAAGVTADRAKVGVDALMTGCDAGWPAGCGLAAIVLKGTEAVRADPTRRRRALQKGAELDDTRAAHELVALRARGDAEVDDVLQRLARREGRCAEKPDRCVVTAIALEGLETRSDAVVAHLHAACQAGQREGCGMLAPYVRGGQADEAVVGRAVDLEAAGCAVDHAPSCLGYGRAAKSGVEVEQADVAEALRAFERACRLGLADGCTEAAALRP